MNITDALSEVVASNGYKTAVICGETRFSYQQVATRIGSVSSALLRFGVAHGDRIAVLALNCHRYFELYYAIPRIGAAVVPINFRLPPREIKYILDHSGSRVVLFDETTAPVINEMRPRLGSVEYFISLTDRSSGPLLGYEDLVESGSPGLDPPQVAADDLAGLFYTSGTTGEPKGVMLSHRNIMANAAHSNLIFRDPEDSVYLHSAPMFHLADGAAVFSATLRGSAHVFIPRFEPKALLETVSREHVTSILLVPTMINMVLQQPDLASYDLSSLRQITYGASPIAPDVLRRAMKAFRCRFVQGYGLTEASPLLTVLKAEDHEALTGDEQNRLRLMSCGKPVPGVDVRIVKDDGTDVRPGEVGEIVARGPNVMLGYWNSPEDTAAAIRDGWLHTGDLATVDEGGYIYLVDRKKDMIVTGGENVFSTEVEAVLYEHPAVKEAAVIPVPDETWGEAIHACLTLREGHQLTQEGLIAFCRGRLANYKIPRSVEIIEGELPKGGTGKVLKKELRERHWRGHARRIG